MKTKLSIVLFSIILSFASSKAEMVTRTRTVVDTVAAMKLINNKYVLYNAPIRSEIEKIDNQLTMNRAALRNNNDSIRTLEYLISKLEPKVKDKWIAEQLASYLEQSIYKLPESEFFALCKQKDYEKAKKKGELILFRGKENERIVNKAKKGDFSSGFAKACFDYLYGKAQGYSEFLSAKETNLKSERIILEKKLKKEPTTFSANLWLSEMPSKDVPTKVITERRERRGEDDLSFIEARSFAVNSSDDVDDIDSVEGKFDGLIKDRLYGYGSTKEDGITYDYDFLVSEKGTVPTLKFVLPTYGEEDCSLETLSSYWDNSGLEKDGIKISKCTEGTTYHCFTFFFENGVWVSKRPNEVKYLTYEECLERLQKRNKKPVMLNVGFYIEDYESKENNSFLLVCSEWLGLPYKSGEEGKKAFLKYEAKYEDVRETYNIPVNFSVSDNIYIRQNYFGDKSDAIFVERKNYPINGKSLLEIFRVDETPGMVEIFEDASIGDGIYLFKVAEGMYNESKSDWEINNNENQWIIKTEY